jgi:hypothetical protein
LPLHRTTALSKRRQHVADSLVSQRFRFSIPLAHGAHDLLVAAFESVSPLPFYLLLLLTETIGILALTSGVSSLTDRRPVVRVTSAGARIFGPVI